MKIYPDGKSDYVHIRTIQVKPSYPYGVLRVLLTIQNEHGDEVLDINSMYLDTGVAMDLAIALINATRGKK